MQDATAKLAVIALCFVLSACGDDNPSSPRDSATELEGSWAGVEAGAADVWVWNFTGASAIVESAGTEVYRGTFKVNTTTTPSRLEITITQSSVPAYVGETALGIYMLSGANLTVAVNEPGVTSYPPDFSGVGARVWNLIRQ